MALGDPAGDILDLGPVGDVTGLRLGTELGGYRIEALAPAREEDALPPALGEEPGGRGSDPARAPGYDGDANVSRVLRLMSTVSVIGSA